MSCLLWKSVTFLSLVWAVRGQSSGDLRLVGNSGQTGGSSGRLEVYYNGQWGTVCDDSFGSNDARVACRQLGFSTYTLYGVLGFSQPSSSTLIWLDDLRCLGTESRLIDCPANTIGVEDCSHSEDVALICTESAENPFSGDLRLVGNLGQTGGSSGRLEFFYSGQWGTLCQDSFGIDNAMVACHQLGYTTYTQYGTVGSLGFSEASSTTPTWLDGLRCLGTESRLINCPANTIGAEDCSHSEDVALICFANNARGLPTGYWIAMIVVGLLIVIPIVTVLIVFSVRSLIRRRRRLALYARSTPLINNAASTDVVGVTASNTQDTAYPVQQPMDQTPPYSPQAPPQNMQPVAVYPTGQYTDPQYHTSYPQQPPAPYSTGPPPAQYPAGQPHPAQYPAGQPPPAQYPAE